MLYASDYPYFGDVHAQKLLTYIINKRFFDTGGTLRDVRNILGLNQIKLLPEYNSKHLINNKSKKIYPSTIVSSPSTHNKNSFEFVLNSIAKLLTMNVIDIKNFCIQFKESWNHFDENILLNVLNLKTKEEIPLILTDLIKDKITLVAPIQNNNDWNSFGYKYFNPSDRAYFAEVFKQTYLANDEEQTLNCISHIFN